MNTRSKSVIVSGSFDSIRSHHVRFLEEAAKLGRLTVLVWPDELVRNQTGESPKFPLAERLYFLRAIRYVSHVLVAEGLEDGNILPRLPKLGSWIWVDEGCSASPERRHFCEQENIAYLVLRSAQIQGFPESPSEATASTGTKVVVTGCYDWFHSGHVRFFQEAAAYGDLYVIVGHDVNLRLLKGDGHPLLPAIERRYLSGSIRYVKEALISSGNGWLDADPEIRRIRPDIYIVNEDGDKGGKREYCDNLGIKYVVLKRLPAPGLAARTSTNLRRSYCGEKHSHDQACSA